MPVATVTRQARRFQAEHGTDLSFAYFRHQALKTRALGQAGAGTSQIFIDCGYIDESQFPRVIGESVLPQLAFPILYKLRRS